MHFSRTSIYLHHDQAFEKLPKQALICLKFYWITAQKMKFYIKDFFSIFDQIRSFQQIWSHLLKKYLMKNFTFCAVNVPDLITLESSLKVCLPSVKLKNPSLIIDLLKMAAIYGILYSAFSYVRKSLYDLVDFFSNDDFSIFMAITS